MIRLVVYAWVTIHTLLEHADELLEIKLLVDALDRRQCLSPVTLLNAVWV